MSETTKQLSLEFEKGMPPAIVLAANGEKAPTPLKKLLGMTLLERTLCTAAEAGIHEFYVVVGPYRDKIIPHIEEIQKRRSFKIHVVTNNRWQEGDISSVLVCRRYLENRFFILRYDQVFESQSLIDLTNHWNPKIACRLLRNGAGATRIMLCDISFLHLVEEIKKKRKRDLSEVIQSLEENRQIEFVDVGDKVFIRLISRESFKRARQFLLSNITKPTYDGFISRHINRHVSVKLSALLASTPITPNLITMISFLLATISGILFALNHIMLTVLAGLIVQFASIIDGCDGELARLEFRCSPFGGFYDTVLDRYADIILIAGITFGFWIHTENPWFWVGGLFAISGFILFSYIKKEGLIRFGHLPKQGILTPSRDMRLFIIFAGSMVNAPYFAILILALWTHLYVSFRLRALSRIH